MFDIVGSETRFITFSFSAYRVVASTCSGSDEVFGRVVRQCRAHFLPVSSHHISEAGARANVLPNLVNYIDVVILPSMIVGFAVRTEFFFVGVFLFVG